VGKKTSYSIIAAVLLIFSVYGILINMRIYATEGLFKFDCCSWMISRYGSIEDKPKKKVE
jgi:hypothetical protein